MIHVNSLSDGSKVITIVISGESVERFKELVHRATNLWPDAHPEIKRFADEICNGEIQQDYGDGVQRPKYNWQHCCPACEYITTLQTLNDKPPEYPIICDNRIPVPDREGVFRICREVSPYRPIPNQPQEN